MRLAKLPLNPLVHFVKYKLQSCSSPVFLASDLPGTGAAGCTTERIDRLHQLQDPEGFAFEDADVRSESPDIEGSKPARLPPKLYKIGDVIQYSGLSRQTIHNYTMLGLITEESRTPSGHRLYGESVFPRLERIQDLKRRMSLREVRAILERGEQ